MEKPDLEALSERVKKLISESLGVPLPEVTDSAAFVDDLGADSLDIVEMVMAIEKEFGIEVPDENAEKIETVQDAIDYISSATNHPSAASKHGSK